MKQKNTKYKIAHATIFLLIITVFYSCASTHDGTYNPYKKIAVESLKEDFSLLKKILEANHPSLYWYTPKDSIDSYFSEAFNTISDSLTETQFKNKVAWFVSKIRCGHTAVRLSERTTDYFAQYPPPKFPLSIKLWQDSLVVLANTNRNDSILKRGAIITSIDGIGNQQLIDSIFQFISMDASSNNFKYQVVSFNFPAFYANAFPLKDSFAIGYIDSIGQQQKTFAKLYSPMADTFKNNSDPIVKVAQTPKISRHQIRLNKLQSRRSLIFDTGNNMAYMRLPSFSGNGFRSFFANSFRTLQNNHTQNLVIDLRENGGGSVGISSILARYIAKKPFHVADTVAAITRNFPYDRFIHPSLVYQFVMHFTSHKSGDNKFHFTMLEKHLYKPYDNLHYNGQVYIIQGGFTFSAAAMFISHVKGQQNITTIGEETGGGRYGMNAVYLPNIVLPNSKVRVILPIYRVVLSQAVKDGHGIQPDIIVNPSAEAVKRGIDLKMAKVKELIKKQPK